MANWNGTPGDDRHVGDASNDLMFAGNGNDTLKGRGGNDRLEGEGGNDVLFGGDGNDICNVGFGDDYAYGGKGDDVISAYDGGYLDGGAGHDDAYVNLFLVSDDIVADLGLLATGAEVVLGNTTLVRVEGGSVSLGSGDDVVSTGDLDMLLQGGAGNDTLRGGATNNHLYGGIGDDVLEGGGGANYLDGGDGFDTLTYAHSDRGVTASLIGGGSSAGQDSVSSFERLVGSDYADSLTGRNSGKWDVLEGGDGNDWINGRYGADTMSGGAGQDVFFYSRTNDSSFAFDLITDLEAVDIIDLRQIDANTAVAGNQAFVLVDALTNVAGEASLTYFADRDQTYLDASVDGGGYTMRIVIEGDWSGFEGLLL